MTFGHSLRSRIALTLSVVVLPVVALTLAWAWNHDRALRAFRASSARHAAALIGSKLDDMFGQARLIGAALAGTERDPALPDCPTRARLLLKVHAAVDGIAVYAGDAPTCAAGQPPQREAEGELAGAMRAQLARGLPMALLPSPSRDNGLLIGVQPAADGPLVVLRMSSAAISRTIDPDTIIAADGIAVLDANGAVLAERHCPKGSDRWVPRRDSGPAAAPGAGRDAAAGVPAAIMTMIGPADEAGPTDGEAESQSGNLHRYVPVAIADTGATLLVGYPAARFFEEERRLFWRSIAQPVIMLTAAVLGAVWAVERLVLRWIHYLRRIAAIYGKGRFFVRARRLDAAPAEIADLGRAFNLMADHLAEHARALQAALDGQAALVRELHHRIKNNFQVIASLLSLHRQNLPSERRDDVRFVEDHVQAMAVGYRVAYASEAMSEVPVAHVLRDVVSGLRRSSGLPRSRLRLELAPEPLALDLDQAIGVGLFLAAALPPRLDQALAADTEVLVRSTVRDQDLDLAIAGAPDLPIPSHPLRDRLVRAYLRQLDARLLPPSRPGELAILVPGRRPSAGEEARA